MTALGEIFNLLEFNHLTLAAAHQIGANSAEEGSREPSPYTPQGG